MTARRIILICAVALPFFQCSSAKMIEKSPVIIYGKSSCPICAEYRRILRENSFYYKYYDIETNPSAREKMWGKVMVWFPGISSVGLPVVEINSRLRIRPDISETKHLQKLPPMSENIKEAVIQLAYVRAAIEKKKIKSHDSRIELVRNLLSVPKNASSRMALALLQKWNSKMSRKEKIKKIDTIIRICNDQQ